MKTGPIEVHKGDFNVLDFSENISKSAMNQLLIIDSWLVFVLLKNLNVSDLDYGAHTIQKNKKIKLGLY